jgi:uncharacterized protein YwbE
MNTIMYITGGSFNKRFFKIKKMKDENTGKIFGEVSRISCAEYDDSKKNVIGLVMPKVGDKVIIITKPYHQYNCKTGIVKDVLTRKAIHTRGHKVRIISNNNIYIGRTLKIL